MPCFFFWNLKNVWTNFSATFTLCIIIVFTNNILNDPYTVPFLVKLYNNFLGFYIYFLFCFASLLSLRSVTKLTSASLWYFTHFRYAYYMYYLCVCVCLSVCLYNIYKHWLTLISWCGIELGSQYNTIYIVYNFI